LTPRVRTILGVDPGIALLGYGVIELEGGAIRHLEHGCVETPAGADLPARLRMLYRGLQLVVDRFPITDVAMESLFHSRNVTTAVAVGQARGVAMLATVREDVAYAEYSPNTVKQVVAGYGRATKRQVQEMMGLIFGLKELPSPDDAADALAIAVCHARQVGVQSLVARALAQRP
jgi:crossover junction endodeoxyribonuclease RuvC